MPLVLRTDIEAVRLKPGTLIGRLGGLDNGKLLADIAPVRPDVQQYTKARGDLNAPGIDSQYTPGVSSILKKIKDFLH